MRPYRKVDMGAELQDHDGRLKKLERLEGQLRVFQALASALLVFVAGNVFKDCQAETQERIDQQIISNKLDHHMRQPHNSNQTAIDAHQQMLENHDDRLDRVEKLLRIKR